MTQPTDFSGQPVKPGDRVCSPPLASDPIFGIVKAIWLKWPDQTDYHALIMLGDTVGTTAPLKKCSLMPPGEPMKPIKATRTTDAK